MIDIKLIREAPQKFIDGAIAKNIACNIEGLLRVDTELKECKQRLQDIVTEKNSIGKTLRNLDDDQKKAALAKLAGFKDEESGIADKIKELQPEYDRLMQQVPQPADSEVPFGEDDLQNVEMRTWGEIRKFDFEPKDHVELGLELGILDIERGVKLAGSRNYFLMATVPFCIGPYCVTQWTTCSAKATRPCRFRC